MKKLLFFIVVSVLLNGYVFAADSRVYGNSINPDAGLAQSIATAEKTGRLVMMVFGADWCSDCRSLNKWFGKKPINNIVSQQLELVYVDVGRWNKNIDFSRKFSSPGSSGIPSFVILDPIYSKQVLIDGREVATARIHGKKKFAVWLSNILDSLRSGSDDG